jgi:iron(III) transport system permease protein
LGYGASLVWLAVLVALPMGYMFITSFRDGGFTLSHYASFVNDPRLREAALNSFVVALCVSVLSVIIGAPLAYGVARTSMPLKRLVSGAIVLSLVSPEFLVAMAYIALAGPNAGYFNQLIRAVLKLGDVAGPLNVFTLWGLAFTAMPHGVAFVFFTLVPALRNIDPALDEAARLQGVSAGKAIRDVVLPLARPALVAGALLAFASSLAMYGPPQLLGMNVLTISIREALLNLDFGGASVASMVLTLMSIVALMLYRASVTRADRFRTLGGKSFAARPLETPAITTALTVLGVTYAFVALIIPYGGMLMVSLMKSVGMGVRWDNWTLANYAAVIGNPAVERAARLSLTLAAASATIVVATSVVIGYTIVRGRMPGRSPLDYLSILPLAVPGTALALALIVLYLSPPLNILGLYGSFGIVLIAYLTRFVPFGVRTSQTAILQMSPELEEASRVFGAGQLRSLLRITVPVMRESLIYSWILIFILALPELSASVVLQSIRTRTISTVLLDVWNGNGGLATGSAFGMIIFFVVALLLLLATLIQGRSRSGSVGYHA